MPIARKHDTETMLKMLETLKKQVEERQEEERKALERRAEEKSDASVHRPQPGKKQPLAKKEEEMLLDIARASLKQFGTIVPPKEALYAVMEADCPHCGHHGLIATDFGFKKWKGGVKPQSWCKWCRSGVDSHPGRRR